VKWFLLLFGFFIFNVHQAAAQDTKPDTIIQNQVIVTADDTAVSQISSKVADSLRHKRIKKTILRSTFIPGWGQVTNRQVWKVPLVAAAITVPAVLFFYNLDEYKSLKQAYIYKVDTNTANDALIPERYAPLSANSIKYYRDSYRQNVDYSALVFILAWGLNVVDAAVFANLKDFDVSDKLSLKIKPGINLKGQSSVGLVLNFKGGKSKSFLTY
jgi:hypothetical protein